jgi:predicted DNA-binding ribbon-helix-helix protein
VEKVKTSISLDKDVYEFIQKLAERERLNVSQVINRDYAKRLAQEGEK